ncbi:hypothetical protein BH24ACT15_BH24ACT15_23150 [soil metagenome]
MDWWHTGAGAGVRSEVNVFAQVLDRWRCRQVGRLLQAHLDGELPAEASADVAAHLEACRRCGMAAEDFTAISAALSTLAVEVDPGVRQRLEALMAELS